MPDELIGEVRKNACEVVRVARTEFNGHDLIDCRIWLPSALPTLPGTPTRKGVAASAECWRQVLPLLAEALAAHEAAHEDEDEGDHEADDEPEAVC